MAAHKAACRRSAGGPQHSNPSVRKAAWELVCNGRLRQVATCVELDGPEVTYPETARHGEAKRRAVC
jgi:hypothetical protein